MKTKRILVHSYHNFLACDISNWLTFGLYCTRILILKIAVWASGVAQGAKVLPTELADMSLILELMVRNNSHKLSSNRHVHVASFSPKLKKQRNIFLKKLLFESYFSHFVPLLCNSIADYKTKVLNQLWKQRRWAVSQNSKNSAKFNSLCKNKNIHFICVQTHFCLYSTVKLHVNQRSVLK